MTALTEAPDLYKIPEDEEARRAYRISSEGEAVWAMRRLRDYTAQQAERQEIAKAERARIDQWLKEANADTTRHIGFFEAILKDYALRVRAASGDEEKQVRTPYGKVTTRHRQAAYEVENADQLLAYALEKRPEWVREKTTKDVLISTVQNALDVETGELVPGVAIRPEGIVPSVDLGENR